MLTAIEWAEVPKKNSKSLILCFQILFSQVLTLFHLSQVFLCACKSFEKFPKKNNSPENV